MRLFHTHTIRRNTMTYQNSFASAIQVQGKILRENNNRVAVPFGAEYSIVLRNLKSVRALCEITIDGESQTDGQKLILDPNSKLVLERSIRNGNLSQGNLFKFIEKTDQIENHRGNRIDDGLVRIEFWAEKIVPAIPWTITTTSNLPLPWNYPGTNNNDPSLYNGILRSVSYPKTDASQNDIFTKSVCQTQNMSETNTSGITVPGGISNQQFVYGSSFPIEDSSIVIIFELIGAMNNQKITEPITVKAKPVCSSCGRRNKATNKFCSGCGTGLILF
jgi:zinc-ribbon domain